MYIIKIIKIDLKRRMYDRDLEIQKKVENRYEKI